MKRRYRMGLGILLSVYVTSLCGLTVLGSVPEGMPIEARGYAVTNTYTGPAVYVWDDARNVYKSSAGLPDLFVTEQAVATTIPGEFEGNWQYPPDALQGSLGRMAINAVDYGAGRDLERFTLYGASGIAIGVCLGVGMTLLRWLANSMPRYW